MDSLEKTVLTCVREERGVCRQHNVRICWSAFVRSYGVITTVNSFGLLVVCYDEGREIQKDARTSRAGVPSIQGLPSSLYPLTFLTIVPTPNIVFLLTSFYHQYHFGNPTSYWPVRGALKTAVNEGRNKVDSMRSSLERLLRLLKYMSSPFQNILRMCKYHLFNQVLYGVMTSAKNRTASITCAKNRSVSTENQRGLTSHITPFLPYRADVLFL